MHEDITEKVLQEPLFGRDKEIEAVLDAVEEGILDKKPVVIFLKGAPQSGKTRFLDEIEFRLGTIKNYTTIRVDEHSKYEDVLAHVRSLSSYKFSEDVPPIVTNELSRLVLGAVEKTPLVFLIDNLDRVEPGFRDFAEFIASLDFNGRFVLILTYTHDLDFIELLEKRKLPNKKLIIELKPFDRYQTRNFVRAYTGGALPVEVADKIYEYSGGSPGLIVNMINIAMEQGVTAIKTSPAIWALAKSILNAFTESELDVLLAAAVYGDKFEADELVEILDLTEQFVKDTLDKAVAWGVILKKDSHYSFEAKLYKKILIETSNREKIKKLHRRIAEVWEGEQRNNELLANHYYEAGLYSEAARYYINVGKMYMKDMKFEEAERVLLKAVNAARKAGDMHAEFDSRFALTDVYKYFGKLQEWQRQIASLYRIAKRLDSDKNLALSALVYADYLLSTDEHSKSLKLALQYVRNPDIDVRERAIEIAIGNFMELGEYEKAEELAKILNELGDRLENDLIKGRGALLLAAIHLEKREFLEAEKLFKQAVEVFSKHGLWQQVMFAIIDLVSIYLQTKRLSSAYEFISRAMNLASQFGNKTIIGHCDVLYGMFLLEVGMYLEAEEFTRKGLALLEKTNHLELYLSALMLLAHLKILTGNPSEGLQLLEKVSSAMAESKDLIPLMIDYNHYLAMAQWKLGNIDRAENLLKEAYESALRHHYPDQAAYIGQDMALFYIETGRLKEGKKIAMESISLARKLKLPIAYAYYALFLASKLEGVEEEAQKYIEGAHSSLVYQAVGLDQNKGLFKSFFENVDLNRKIRREWLKYHLETHIEERD